MRKLFMFIAALTLSAGMWAETLTVSYDYPVYNTLNDPKSGIASWQTGSVDAIIVESSDDVVYWGTDGQESWYVVTGGLGGIVQLTKGAVCRGDVHLILYSGLLRTGEISGQKKGIIVSGNNNSLTIYGANGELVTTGEDYAAGIGGGPNGSGSNITINGGWVTAKGVSGSAGIGGGYKGFGSNITINGGKVIARSEKRAAGIGGGEGGSGSYITINGGIVDALGGEDITGIGGGADGQSSNIFVATPILLKAGSTSDDAIETPHFTGYDMAAILKGKRQVKVEEGKAKPYAEGETAGYARGKNDGINEGKAAGKAEAKAELLGDMATPCTGCTAVEVTDGTTTVKLYNATGVDYVKVPSEE